MQTFRAGHLCTLKAAAIFWGAIPTYGVLLYAMIYSMTILPSGENCFVLQSRQICSLFANFPQRLLLAVCEFRAAGEERCQQGN